MDTKKDRIEPEELSALLNVILDKKTTYVQNRRVATLSLVYVTGLKINQVIKFKKQDLIALFNNQSIELDFFKDKNLNGIDIFFEGRIILSINPAGLKFLKQYETCFNTICQEKHDSWPLFSREEFLDQPLVLSVFERDLANTVKWASNKIGKYFRAKRLLSTEKFSVVTAKCEKI